LTEREWIACDDPIAPMLEFLRGKASDRKLRLFAVACCRRVWDLLADSRSQRAVEVAERFADGRASEEELRTAAEGANAVRQAAYQVLEANTAGGGWDHEADAQCNLADYAADVVASEAYTAARSVDRQWRLQSDILRDIFGNPFRPLPTLDPAWLRWHDATISRLAQQMYDSRDFASMPILADALEEAGCTSADILDHCRGPGPHVRACWVVDQILGKQ
jgi:hypothetical protein